MKKNRHKTARPSPESEERNTTMTDPRMDKVDAEAARMKAKLDSRQKHTAFLADFLRPSTLIQVAGFAAGIVLCCLGQFEVGAALVTTALAGGVRGNMIGDAAHAIRNAKDGK